MPEDWKKEAMKPPFGAKARGGELTK